MPLSPFVSPEQLPAMLSGDDPPAIVDVRWSRDGDDGHAAYVAGHLPGAVHADLDRDLAGPPTAAGGRHPLPDAAAFAAVLGRLGIGDHTRVVAYDPDSGAIAARLVWMLRILGREAAVLSGGLAGWEGPLEQGPVERPTAWSTPRPWPADAVADADRVSAVLAEGGPVLDVRDPARYRGEVEPIDPVAGHIPGAVNAPYVRNIGPDGRVLSGPGLRARYAEVGLGEDQAARDVIVYCGSGVTACHAALAVESAGLGRPRVYVGSWSAWSADPSRPVAVTPDR